MPARGPGTARRVGVGTDEAVALAGAAAYAASSVVFRRRPAAAERSLFLTANASPPQAWLRVPQQLGTPWALVVTSGTMLLRRRHSEALVALVALPVEKGLEVATKKVLERPRPVRVTPTRLRDDAPRDGPAFPSGHSAIATAATYLLARTWPPLPGAVLAVTCGVSSYTRVHQGAHWPADVLGGSFLGLAVAAGLRASASRTRRLRGRPVR